jgi:hypothetical protein
MNPNPIDANESYVAEYWRYLRGETEQRPTPEQHGLTATLAKVLEGQCAVEFARKYGKEKPCVS